MAGTPKKRAKKQVADVRRAEREANGGKRIIRNPTPEKVKQTKKDSKKAALAAGEELEFGDFPKATWELWIETFCKRGRQDLACKAAGIPRQTVYRRSRQDAEFARLLAEVREMVMDSLEDEAIRRGRDGWNEPSYGREGFQGWIRKFDSGLLQFMLMHGRADKYRPKKDVDLTINPASQPPVINVTLNHAGAAPTTEKVDG